MTYKIKIGGKEYTLPARTLAVDDRIEEISGLDKRYEAGELTRREVVEAIHGFVESMAPGAFPVLEEADTNELMTAAIDAINAYKAPERRDKINAQTAQARELLKTPEFQKLLAVAPMLARQK